MRQETRREAEELNPLNGIIKSNFLEKHPSTFVICRGPMFPVLSLHVSSAPTFPYPRPLLVLFSCLEGIFLFICACWTPTAFRVQSQCHFLQEVSTNPIIPNPSLFALCSYGSLFMPPPHYLHMNLWQKC